MGNPYTSTTVSGYNSNPPPDDGSVSAANRGKWSDVKTKIGDPLNNFAAAINTALVSAFGKIIGGAGISSVGSNYNVVAGDQGKILRVTAAGVVVTTPNAAVVGTPFVFTLLNNSTGDITLDGFDTQTVDGGLTISI